jgi:spermidine synthase
VAAASTFAGAASPRAEARSRLALALMVMSGFAALGYQIVWTQQASLWLGHESAAVLAVVAAFFGGLGLGALLFGPRIERSAHPAAWYAACEVVIGAWGLVLMILMDPVSGAIARFLGPEPTAMRHWTLAFGGLFILLLPATAAMGATLPAMERVLAALRAGGSRIGALYAGNTLGALLGVLATAFWLVPALGLTRTALFCMGLNFACALLALRLFDTQASARPVDVKAAPGPLALLWLTGLLGIGYEVLVVRALSQVNENTVYTFALLLAVYLGGTALGAAAYQRWLARSAATPATRDRLLQALAAACVLGIVALYGAATMKRAILAALPEGAAAGMLAEAAVATAAFLPPTLVMGALFSHLATAAGRAGISFGRALGVNTLGAAVAPALGGVLLAPALGLKFALLIVVAAYLALASGARRGRAALPSAAVAAAVVAVALWAPPLAFVDIPEGGRVVSYRDGAMASVSVVEDADGVATLHIDNRQQEGSSATLTADARQALLPLMLHPAPRRALFLGLGTGATSSAAAWDRSLEVDVVELLPEVVEASALFRQGIDDGPSRLRVIVGDARRYVRSTPIRYDLIVADNFHPARSGSGALYTVEHFAAVRDRLAPGGVFVQWLPLHQLDLATLRSIVRAFASVHPAAWAMLATNSLETPVLGLVAREDGQRFDIDQARARLASADLSPRSPAEFGIVDEYALFGSFVAGPRSLRAFAGEAPNNTDDHPVVSHRAPLLVYSAASPPRDRLLEFVRAAELLPEELLAPEDVAASAERLAAYWAARSRFLEAGRSVKPSADARRMLADVQDALLAVLQISADFRPAYDPLLAMAKALARSDPHSARRLLAELDRLQPARHEAAAAIRELDGLPRPSSSGSQ